MLAVYLGTNMQKKGEIDVGCCIVPLYKLRYVSLLLHIFIVNKTVVFLKKILV